MTAQLDFAEAASVLLARVGDDMRHRLARQIRLALSERPPGHFDEVGNAADGWEAYGCHLFTDIYRRLPPGYDINSDYAVAHHVSAMAYTLTDDERRLIAFAWRRRKADAIRDLVEPFRWSHDEIREAILDAVFDLAMADRVKRGLPTR